MCIFTVKFKQMENLGRLYRQYIKHPLVSFNWNIIGEKLFDLLVVSIAYTRVVIQRSGLLSAAERLAAATFNIGVVRHYEYNKSLDALKWAYLTEKKEKNFNSNNLANATQRLAYLNNAAQVLLLNNATNATFGHSFHVLSPSPLPVSFALSLGGVVLTVLLSLRGSFHDSWFVNFFGVFALSVFVAIIVIWLILVGREEYSGAHTLEVQKSFRIGIVLFIASEFMLFVAFFWAFFHFSLNPSAFTGSQFVPQGLVPFFWYRIPLVNTVILLSSGLSLTVAHAYLNVNDMVLRTRQWLQVAVSGFYLVRRPFHTMVSHNDYRLLEKTAQQSIPDLFIENWARYRELGGVVFPVDSWMLEVITFDDGRGPDLNKHPERPVTKNGYHARDSRWNRIQRLYDRITPAYENTKEVPYFSAYHDNKVHNAICYAFDNIHSTHNKNVILINGGRPNRSVRRYFPVAIFPEYGGKDCNVLHKGTMNHYYRYVGKKELEISYGLITRDHQKWLLDTIVRGFLFLSLQTYEYISGLFTIADSAFGAVFYTLTGLHGIHVFVGVIMLMGCRYFNRKTAGEHQATYKGTNIPEFGQFYWSTQPDYIRTGHFASRLRNLRLYNWWYHRVAFDGAAWYWHFVDVVWLFVFIFVYWYAFPANIVIIAS